MQVFVRVLCTPSTHYDTDRNLLYSRLCALFSKFNICNTNKFKHLIIIELFQIFVWWGLKVPNGSWYATANSNTYVRFYHYCAICISISIYLLLLFDYDKNVKNTSFFCFFSFVGTNVSLNRQICVDARSDFFLFLILYFIVLSMSEWLCMSCCFTL